MSAGARKFWVPAFRLFAVGRKNSGSFTGVGVNFDTGGEFTKEQAARRGLAVG
jgi:hypothetical protein